MGYFLDPEGGGNAVWEATKWAAPALLGVIAIGPLSCATMDAGMQYIQRNLGGPNSMRYLADTITYFGAAAATTVLGNSGLNAFERMQYKIKDLNRRMFIRYVQRDIGFRETINTHNPAHLVEVVPDEYLDQV